MNKYKELELLAVAIAKEAGELILARMKDVKAVVDKGTHGFATQVDIDSEALIVSRIKEKYPDHAILAEEGSSMKNTSEYTWVIDPIDGTHNFMHGIPFFCVSIGIKQNDKHVVGVVHAPVLNETYAASKDNGTSLNDMPIHTSATAKLSDAFLLVELTRKVEDSEFKMIQELGSSIFRYRSLGSAALSLAYVAAGKVDGYVDLHRMNNEWDWAGGRVLVEESGGTWALTKDNMVIASNSVLHSDLVAIVEQ